MSDMIQHYPIYLARAVINDDLDNIELADGESAEVEELDLLPFSLPVNGDRTLYLSIIRRSSKSRFQAQVSSHTFSVSFLPLFAIFFLPLFSFLSL